MMESCSKLGFSQKCFDFMKNISGAHYAFYEDGEKIFGEEGKADVIIRRYASSLELRTWA